MAEEKVIMTIEAKTEKADKSLEKVKKTTKDVGNAAKDAAQEFTFMGVSINGVKNSINKAIPIIKGMFTSFKAGLISTGIGAFVVAVGSLISYFTSTKKGAEQLQVALKSVGAAISVARDRISSLGGAIVKVFKGDIKGAIQDAKGAVTGFGDEVRKEVKQMAELTKASQALRDSNRELNVETARRRAEVEALKFVAEDTTKSEAERLEAAEKAFRLENELLQMRVANAKENLRIKSEEVAASESTAEDLDELAQAEIDLFTIQQESITKQIELNNKINGIKREAEAKRLEAIKAEEEAEKKALEDKQAREAEQEKIRQDAEAAREAYEKEQADAKKKRDEEEKQRAIDVQKSKLDATKQTLDGIKAVFGEESAAGKAASVVQATINTYEGISAALASSPPPFNIALAAITGAAGFKNVASILSTPIPKYNMGGIVGGYGTGTSDSVNAKLSKGESVINARSTRMFKPILSAINEAGGGRSFATGDGTGGATPGVVKAFVVADDMTRQQDKLTKIRRKATI